MGEFMQVRKIVLGYVAVSLLAGCSMFASKEVDYEAGAVKVQPLEVPPNLVKPETDPRYAIPGKEGEKVAKYSEYNKQQKEQPCLAPEDTPPAKAAPAARLHEGNGAKVIQFGEPFDRSWRKIGLALDRARIKVTDKDRSKGIYFISVPDTEDKQKTSSYQVLVRETGEGSETSVIKADGKGDATTGKLVETLFSNLEEKAASAGKPANGNAVRPAR